jgi:hypothetical protein
MNWKNIMEYIFKAISELISIFRIHKEVKKEEIEIKNTEVFKEREVSQQEIDLKDRDEELISTVIKNSGELRESSLEEIRKIIAK